jgi:hypothetical protein
MSPSSETEAGRLNGWKEIAVHLGKGPRTVQRWEKLYGLPVHRIGREGGEIVFAFRDEIDRWLAATERRATNGDARLQNRDDAVRPDDVEPEEAADRGASARPNLRRGRRWTTATLLVALVALTLGALSALRRQLPPADRAALAARAGREPAAWRLANESLTVLDVTGRVVFEHRFGFALGASTSSDTWRSDRPPPVLIADLDGDDHDEVLVAATDAVERANRRLYCFEADGRTRFVHQPTGSRRFGNEGYSDPWLVHGVFVTRAQDGARRLWAVFTHNLLFPSVLRELDPRTGTPRQEYWSDGFIEHVAEGSWSGRPVVLVGGTNNDFRAASLAVFPANGVSGSTPALRPAYACRNCPPGAPEALFLFPTLCIGRGRGQATVVETWIERGDLIRVRVEQPGILMRTSTYYTIGPDGAVVGAEISPEFQAEHARLERRGEIDHPFGPRDDADMFPVRRWDGRAFVDLPRTPVAH